MQDLIYHQCSTTPGLDLYLYSTLSYIDLHTSHHPTVIHICPLGLPGGKYPPLPLICAVLIGWSGLCAVLSSLIMAAS